MAEDQPAPKSEPGHEVTTTAVTAQLRIHPPADDLQAPFLYANFIQGSATPHEITLHFADYMALVPGERPPDGVIDIRARPLVSVAMPANLVRGVIDILQQQLAAWEKSFQEQRPSPEATARDEEPKP